MKHLVSQIAVRISAQGELTVDLFTGKRRVGTVYFAEQPAAWVEVPAEVSEPFALHYPTSMVTLVLDLLRSGEGVEFDRETGELVVADPRAGR